MEAFNLKAAIEYSMKNVEAAREALLDMPPRNEDELDPVTLHNKALMHCDENPNAAFKRLNFLIHVCLSSLKTRTHRSRQKRLLTFCFSIANIRALI